MHLIASRGLEPVRAFCPDRKLKKVDLIQTGHMDSQLKELWAEITL